MQIQKGNTLHRTGMEGKATAIHMLPSISIHLWEYRVAIQINFLIWWVNFSFKRAVKFDSENKGLL